MSDERASDALPETADLYLGSVLRLSALFDLAPEEIGHFELVSPTEMPTDYRTLLAHTGHMTVTLEAFHNSLVDVRVLREGSDPASYWREILLSRHSDGRVVQFGLMRIWVTDLPAKVRQEIEARGMPLGRILIRHGLLREVELLSLWSVTPTPVTQKHFGSESAGPLYGRSAQILVDGRPTVQLLEIVQV